MIIRFAINCDDVRAQLSVAVLIGAVVLSGCTSGSSETSALAAPKEAVDADSLAGSELGAVQGHVYTDDLQPIEGASVGLAGLDVEDTTDAAGFFVLPNVVPGKHVLAVGRLGYESVARNVEVVAGELTETDVTLTPIEIEDEAYGETVRITGFLECAMGTAAFVAPCTYPYRLVHGAAMANGVNLTNYGLQPDLHPNKFWLNITIKPKAEQLVAQLTWQAGSAAAQRMNLFLLCGDFDPVLNECTERIRYGLGNGHSGTNPIRAVIDAKEFRTKGCPASKFCLKEKPIWIANDVAMPFQTPPQLAFQQRFEVWDTVFFNAPGPDDFSALPDG